MTTTTDPRHPAYVDEADVRREMARVHDVCHGCRRCVDYCAAFPTLFEMLDAQSEPAAAMLTPSQQDVVVDACFQCTLCVVECPYGPEVHEANVDMPRLMLRARAMQYEHGHLGTGGAAAARVLARPDRVGRLASRIPRIANRVVGSPPGSIVRRILARLTGVSAERTLAAFANQRFSAWFAERPGIRMQRRQAAVTIFPTCIVEYQATSVGKDLVRVYERNGVECSVSGASCCGAPLLHAGDIATFAKVAARNISQLASEIRAGTDVIVAQPDCHRVLTADSADHVVTADARADAELVAAHTYDASHYLMTLHRADGDVLDTDFSGTTRPRVAYHASNQVRARQSGFASRDLMRLTGARVDVVQQPSGTEGIWSLRAGRSDGEPIAARLADQLDRAGSTVTAGDSHLSNLAIGEHLARPLMHPLEVLARAYGIAAEPDRRSDRQQFLARGRHTL